MLNDLVGAGQIYIACGNADLRNGIGGFTTLVQQKFRLAPFSGTLFLPCGYRQDWNKRLYWEEDGFVLVTKRLEAGSFQWPRNSAEARRLSYQQYP